MIKPRRNPNTTCSGCDAPIYRRPCEISEGPVFCSKECHSESRKLFKSCLHCGDEFRARSSKKCYCSVSCSNRARKGIRYQNVDRKSIETIKKDLLALRGGRCEDCGFDKVSIIQVHHLVQKRDGGTNDPSNLRLLCPNCHYSIHCDKRE